jgi:hypothetical protein
LVGGKKEESPVDLRKETQGGAPEDQQHHARQEEGDPVIQTRDLTKVYRGGISAVDGIDLSVRRLQVRGRGN